MYILLTNQVIMVGTTATKLPPTPLVGRNYIFLTNLDTARTVFIGNINVAHSGSNRGTLLQACSYYYGSWTDEVDIYGITSTGSVEVVVDEGK
jgi:hypothetical protein